MIMTYIEEQEYFKDWQISLDQADRVRSLSVHQRILPKYALPCIMQTPIASPG